MSGAGRGGAGAGLRHPAQLPASPLPPQGWALRDPVPRWTAGFGLSLIGLSVRLGRAPVAGKAASTASPGFAAPNYPPPGPRQRGAAPGFAL